MSEEIWYQIENFAEQLEGMTLYTGAMNLISSAVSIATYVLTALALYTMAKRRGIHNPWLSWIPVGDCWILGSLADQYRYVARGETKKKRKTLLTLSILTMVFIFLAVIVLVAGIVMVIVSSSDDMAVGGILMICLCGLLFLAMLGIIIANTVVWFMALYDVYMSCDPEHGVLFTVLSIFFSITRPFFLFFSRNKDRGMVRQAPQYYQNYQNYQNYQQPQNCQNAQNYQNPGISQTPQDQQPWKPNQQ